MAFIRNPEHRHTWMAIKIKIIAGADHATSIKFPSKMKRFVILLITSIVIVYDTIVKIIILITGT